MSRTKKKTALQKSKRTEVRDQALKLLSDPDFFGKYLDILERGGLAGEQRNACVLLVAGISRLLPRPVNTLIKGNSSSGKNFLVNKVLELFPKDAVREITSSSDHALNYASDDFRHKIVYLQERNESSGPVHAPRLLISENKITRKVTVREGQTWTTKTFITRGPVAAISTTTKNQLQIDDETRHISLWVDESPSQTRRILVSQSEQRNRPSGAERKIWEEVHRLLEERSRFPIVVPEWSQQLADMVNVENIRSRRYFPIFISAWMAIALLRSFLPGRFGKSKIGAGLDDFAIAWILFEPVFEDSINRGDDANRALRDRLQRMMQKNENKPISAEILANDMKISRGKAHRLLKKASDAGVIERANKPERGNRKLYRPAPYSAFLPSPDQIFQRIPEIGNQLRFLNPLTGEWVPDGLEAG